jgi:feruloyl esterase
MRRRHSAATLAALVMLAGSLETTAQSGTARPATLMACETLGGFTFPKTVIGAATVVAAGALTNAGAPVGEHCLVTGAMNRRISQIDGETYAIGFEVRLPREWNGRFLYQGNGGTDGVVVPAVGAFVGGGPLKHALQLGFAVISSDAGHSASQNPLFGLDPQARLDYGYRAVGTLTPMAKALIRAAYGKAPDRSYIGGSSNGGRHVLVAAARYATDFDGFLALSPGFNLPKAAIAQLYGAQQWARVATTTADLETALPKSERRLIADAVLARCDALDGLADGLVQDIDACRGRFDLMRDVATCAGARDGTCLTPDQKGAITAVFTGARNSRGEALYSGFPFDAGIAQNGWADWKFRSAVGAARDPVAVAFIFSSPPMPTTVLSNPLNIALTFDVDRGAPKIFATSGVYAESSMSFMTPPNPAHLDALRDRGAKVIVIHGAADAAFSIDDTTAWYQALDERYEGAAAQFVRFFRVPGMGHSRSGPATDQFDALTALVEWVEHGQAPDRIVAAARGAGNPGGVNTDVPSNWSPTRTRPLCAFPLVARYRSGDPESASSFSCER